MAQSIETITGRDGLLLPVVNPRPIESGVFSQFFYDLNRLNGLGLYDGNEIYIPPVVVPDSDRLRPALLLRYARDPLPAQQMSRNRQSARPGSSDWGQHSPYTTGHEEISVMEMPKQTGAIKKLVTVRQELQSQHLVVGLAGRRSQPSPTVYWRGKDINFKFTPREEQLSYLTSRASVLSRFFKRTVKLFAA